MLDEIDVKILDMLQKNARATASEIGSHVGMSVSAVSERIKKLETSGIISKYTAIIDREKAHKDVIAFSTVMLDHPKYNDGFVAFAENCHDILEVHYMAGDADYMIKIVTDSMATLEQVLRNIKCVPGVTRTNSTLVLSSVKNEFSVKPESSC